MELNVFNVYKQHSMDIKLQEVNLIEEICKEDTSCHCASLIHE